MINRVFKLMDEYKRGIIELTDLKRLFTSELSGNGPLSIAGGKNLKDRSSFEWRINAK